MTTLYPVTAECVDERNGKRFFPGDNFTPAPTATQLARLTAAGCIVRPGVGIDPAAAVRAALGGDTLFERSLEQLKEIAHSEKIDLGKARTKPDVIAAIRQARSVPSGDGLDGLPVDTLRMLAGGLGIAVDEKTDPTTLAALIRNKRALGTQSADYERDGLRAKPLGDQTRDELLVTAAYEKADVNPEADVAMLIAAIEVKRSASA